MSTLVYVHGTNGSGKSTLARELVVAAGGATQVLQLGPRGTKAPITRTAQGLVLLGKYGNACGGVDGYSPYAAVLDVLVPLTTGYRPRSMRPCVFGEGLVTPGVETCQRMAERFMAAHFVHLDTPVPDCIAHVLQRRKAKGTTKPYDPANLYKKAKTAASWADRLERHGLTVHRLQYSQAYTFCLETLGLQAPSLETLLA